MCGEVVLSQGVILKALCALSAGRYCRLPSAILTTTDSDLMDRLVFLQPGIRERNAPFIRPLDIHPRHLWSVAEHRQDAASNQ